MSDIQKFQENFYPFYCYDTQVLANNLKQIRLYQLIKIFFNMSYEGPE